MEIKNCYTLRKLYTNSVGIEFVFIPAGSFIMGSDQSYDATPEHRVTITKPFFIGKYPVTQEQWKKVMDYNFSYVRGNNLPVEAISWNDTQEFIQKLNQKENTNKYRLPTEAEWEYSCKAQTKTYWFFGNDPELLDNYGWYFYNAGKKTHPVGLKRPNPWGLYDMYGNVREWCQDWYDNEYYVISPEINPTGPETGYSKVTRGGSWRDLAEFTTSAFRLAGEPNKHYINIGFRLVKTI